MVNTDRPQPFSCISPWSFNSNDRGVLDIDEHPTSIDKKKEVHLTNQWSGTEELVPSDDDVAQIQIVEHNLGNTHEYFLTLDSAVITPYSDLKVNKTWIFTKLILKRKNLLAEYNW